MNTDFWKNRRVFITGHTGFKGGWTSLWLSSLGAKVYGYSLPPPTSPSFFLITKLHKKISKSFFGNIIDLRNLIRAMNIAKPSIIIHMAAQSLVRESYKTPVNTFMTNTIGTVNVFEASRQIKTVKAIINVTSDKCYDNKEKYIKTYRENDPLGGYDPYSSSKACSEIVTNAYRASFLNSTKIFVASARAGNVIGGGDWASDRLIPDFFKALNSNKILRIRFPKAIRPWQHVLEPISGYLNLAEKLFKYGKKYAESWNFGPNEKDTKSVNEILSYLSTKFKISNFKIENKLQLHEAKFLKLNSSKAKSRLFWNSKWNIELALNKTIEWYQAWKNNEDMFSYSISQIHSYEKFNKKNYFK
jgi:CDP-glucose 4,6-dehydratase